MSIKLSVDPYCQDCPEFFPDSSMIRYMDNDGKPRTLVYVYCSHRDGCRHAVKHAGEKDDAEPQTTGEDFEVCEYLREQTVADQFGGNKRIEYHCVAQPEAPICNCNGNKSKCKTN